MGQIARYLGYVGLIIAAWSSCITLISASIIKNSFGTVGNIFNHLIQGKSIPFSFVASLFLLFIIWVVVILFVIIRSQHICDEIDLLIKRSIKRSRKTKRGVFGAKNPPYSPLKKGGDSLQQIPPSLAKGGRGDFLSENKQSLPEQQKPEISPSEERITAETILVAQAMAVFEVWQEPPPVWMKEALIETLSQLSPEGFLLFDAMGRQGKRILALAERLGVETYHYQEEETDGMILNEKTAELENIPAKLTVTAALLSELLDNYRVLGSSQDKERDETCLSLQQRMADMTEHDWESLDQFPELARHIRVSTDQLREMFRKNNGRLLGGEEIPPTPLFQRGDSLFRPISPL